MHSWLCRHLGARTASTLPRTSFAGPFHHSLTSWQHHYPECNPEETEDQSSLITLLQGLNLTAFLLRGAAAGGPRPH